ncbi:F-box protein At4g00755 [Pistacia vera]|uniref:F-box protein At4g00755 n=1 Tax=Pistacia vera TaxID=55513 RepID=UPI001263C0E2|nr:F-box protein At4g00755 [Pistacia vera]XP_031261386.1 F-box protein At4g00755 [Pistacia vera]XP_031261387.1 F-box protein At4g00755 [Pistacia vera]XP_031261388.1 F-box protein At4g00755 [Pistacia vera]XP_031261389.1 F-box protein At4g00755 [Pistacia vera]
MENPIDFLDSLDRDMSMKILMCLDDLSDLVRVSCVSPSWRHHVIENGLCKQLCLRMFPQLSKVDHVVEPSCRLKEPAEGESENFVKGQSSESENRVYTFLARGCTSFPVRGLIFEPIYASSTDNYPEESIHNTLEPSDRVARRASYWSSKGHSNPAVPETLIYKLVGDLCVISEINIQPFKAYFQWGLPIYSARAVRFRMGHAKSPIDDPMGEASNDSTDDKFVWTYTSQEFPMAQENRLQKFKLPEPVMCIGGILKIELLGRIQKQEMDGLYYICVSHVQIVGRSLSPTFGVDILEPSGKFVLKVNSYTKPSECEDSSANPSVSLRRSVADLGQIINILRGNVFDGPEYEWGEEDDSDDEFLP